MPQLRRMGPQGPERDDPADALHLHRRVLLAADVAGPAGAPTVVLMHGGGQTRHSWAGARRQFTARGYRVINFDARGSGDSDGSATAAHALDDGFADLAAVVAGIATRWYDIGW